MLFFMLFSKIKNKVLFIFEEIYYFQRVNIIEP